MRSLSGYVTVSAKTVFASARRHLAYAIDARDQQDAERVAWHAAATAHDATRSWLFRCLLKLRETPAEVRGGAASFARDYALIAAAGPYPDRRISDLGRVWCTRLVDVDGDTPVLIDADDWATLAEIRTTDPVPRRRYSVATTPTVIKNP